MSSRVTAVRSSQPRIGVGTSDNMIDLLLRTPRRNGRRGQRGAGTFFSRGVRKGLRGGWRAKSKHKRLTNIFAL